MTDAAFIAWLRRPSARVTVLLEVYDVLVDGVPTHFYLSSRPYVSGAGQTPAHTSYQPIVVGGLRISLRLSLDGPNRAVSGGDVELDNTDGQRSAWLGHVWQSRRLCVYMGDVTWPRADFRLMVDAVTGGMDSRQADVLNLSLLDKMDRLNAPISEALVGGTGPAKDRLMPLCFGEPFNVEPVLVDPATSEYAFHAGQAEDVVEARYAGDPVDVAITKLLGTGRLRCNSAVSGPLAITAQGDKPAGVYSNTIGALVRRIATGYGPAATRFTDADLDLAALSAFDTAHPQRVGLYISERKNALEAMQELADSVGAQVVRDLQGKLSLVQIALPPSGTPTVVTNADFEMGSLHVSQVTPVRAAVRLGYARNWTPGQQVAAGVVPSSQAVLSQEWPTVLASDPAVASDWRLSTDVPMRPTLLIVESEAQAEAARELALWCVPRKVYTARCWRHMLLTPLGAPMTLQDDEFGLVDGKTGMVVAIDLDLLDLSVDIGVLA